MSTGMAHDLLWCRGCQSWLPARAFACEGVALCSTCRPPYPPFLVPFTGRMKRRPRARQMSKQVVEFPADMAALAKFLKAHRTSKKMTLDQVIAAAGAGSRSWLSRVENEQAGDQVWWICRVLAAFGYRLTNEAEASRERDEPSQSV